MRKTLFTALMAVMLMAGVAHAQTLNGTVSSLDPCELYPHAVATVSTLASPTNLLVTGIANLEIDVCAIHFSQQSTTAAPLTLAYGQAMATGTLTPCASITSTANQPGGYLSLGGGVIAGAVNIGSGDHTIYKVPAVPVSTTTAAASGLPVTTDLCASALLPLVSYGSIEYVQVKPLGK